MQDLVENPLANIGGWTTVVTSITLSLFEWLARFPINDILQSVASFGAIIFLWYKIRMIHLELKLKKEECKQNKKKDE